MIEGIVDRLTSVALAALVALALAGCGGGDDSTSSGGSSEAVTPEVAMQRLQDAGYTTGEIITDGANMAVAQNGKLDAEAYLGIDNDPDGGPLYAGIYFFDSPQNAAVLAKEDEQPNRDDFDVQLVDNRVYEISGDPADLQPIVDAAEGE